MPPEPAALQTQITLIHEQIGLLAMGLRELTRALENLLGGVTMLNDEIKRVKRYLELP